MYKYKNESGHFSEISGVLFKLLKKWIFKLFVRTSPQLMAEKLKEFYREYTERFIDSQVTRPLNNEIIPEFKLILTYNKAPKFSYDNAIWERKSLCEICGFRLNYDGSQHCAHIHI